MTPKRAFWEAVATVCVPSLLIWGFVGYLLRAKIDAEAWPIYLVLVILPLPLCIPLYRRYLKGPRFRKPHSRFYHASMAILAFIIATGYLLSFLRSHDKGGLWFYLLATLGWLLLGVYDLFRARRFVPSKEGNDV